MAERRDISDSLREAVDRTVRATVDTRDRAQDAVDDLSGTMDELVRGAEKGIRTGRRSVSAVVVERLPATQEDVKAVRTELRAIVRRLDAIEERLPPAAKKKRGPKKKSGKKSKAS
ncbi:MAG: hypothetical protein WKF29_09355 [Thermoleophilaceae bacterium]